MKLYTEEQIKKVLHPDLFYLILPQLIPIELPSDEEINREASNKHYGTNFKHVFYNGGNWVIEKIKNQIK